MNTKIAIKSDSVTPFGGIFYAMGDLRRLGLDPLIDNSLGLRSSFVGYQYSEIISSLSSPDTLLRGIKELSESDIEITLEFIKITFCGIILQDHLTGKGGGMPSGMKIKRKKRK